jgi:hypothetical protein
MHTDFTPLFEVNGSEQATDFLNAGWEL